MRHDGFGNSWLQRCRKLLYKSWTAGCILMIGVAGCGTPVGPSSVDGSIFPLEVGNSWIGRSTWYNAEGGMIRIFSDTLAIVSKQSTGGIVYYTNRVGTFHETEEGIYFKFNQFNLEPRLLLVQNPVAGESFGFDTTRSRVGTTGCDTVIVSRHVVSTSQAFVVPNGSYMGSVFVWQELCSGGGSPSVRSDSSAEGFVKGIGPVFSSHFRRDSQGEWFLSSQWELVSYSLN